MTQYKPIYFNSIVSRKNPLGNRDCRRKPNTGKKNATAEKTTPITMEEKIQQYQTKYIPNVAKQMIQIPQEPKNHR